MSSAEVNVSVGAIVAAIGFASWSMVLLIEPRRHPIGAPVLALLSLGMLLVSGFSLAHETWLVSVIAAANRAIVAGAGIRALWQIHHARSARRES